MLAVQKKDISDFTIMSKMIPTVLDFLCESEHNVSILKNISFPFHLTPPIDKITMGIMELFLFPELFIPL